MINFIKLINNLTNIAINYLLLFNNILIIFLNILFIYFSNINNYLFSKLL